MMEFIIVFPIYLVLFATTFVIGDMLIHSNRLASADRIAAFGVDGILNGGWNMVVNGMFRPDAEKVDDDFVDDLGTGQDILDAGKIIGRYAHDEAPWSVCAAVSVRSRYKPPAGGVLGQLLFADDQFSRIPEGSSSGDDTVVGVWRKNERIDMTSKKSYSGARYSYYTLKRNRSTLSWHDVGNDPGDRNMVSALLRSRHWEDDLINEGFHNDSTVNGGQTSYDSCTPVPLMNYQRFNPFETWSR